MFVAVGGPKDILNPASATLAAPNQNTQVHLARTDYEDQTSTTCKAVRDNSTYSSTHCIDSCLARKLEVKCSCTSLDCYTDRANFCYRGNMTLYNQLLKECLEQGDCPEPCSSTKFSVFSSATTWPNDGVLSLKVVELQQIGLCSNAMNDSQAATNCENLLAKSLVRVEVSFPDFHYQTFTQSYDYTFEDLMSAIGGLTGLFIGSSFLTMAELIEVLYILIAVQVIKARKLPKKSLRSLSLKLHGPQQTHANTATPTASM
eukprot:c4308_g1_i1.p1 GENE.c4308_g1_i1~~c4308_g1_i1.p1  ORF type:complete len:260 (-),score=65.20 c4308_g1_i1:253-1032(-)